MAIPDISKAFIGKLEPEEVNYVTVSGKKGQMCANCRWFRADFDSAYACFLVDATDSDDQPILATGVCDRWEATPAETETPDELLAEAIVSAIQESSDVITSAVLSPSLYGDLGKSKKTFKQRLMDLLRPPQKNDSESFSVFKGVDDQWMWHSIHTNNFKDLEDEILTEKAHDNYIKRLDMGLVPMPVLQGWHTPGTEHGQADIVWRKDHFVHAVGHFYDTPIAKNAIQYYRKNAGKLKMSHGFTSPEWAFDGTHYDDYNTIEITTLPAFAAANPYTSFEELKTMASDMNPEKEKYLIGLIGKDRFAELQTASVQRGKALEEMQVQYKDHSNVTPAADAPAAETDLTVKTLGEIYSDIATDTNKAVDLMVLNSKALTALDTKVKSLEQRLVDQAAAHEKALNEVLGLLNQPPRRASQDAATTVLRNPPAEGQPTGEVMKDNTPVGGDPLQAFVGNLPLKKN